MADSISIDSSKCNGCMLCTEVCVINFERSADGKAVRKADATYCMKCGHCAAACPTGAISLTAIDMSQIRPIKSGFNSKVMSNSWNFLAVEGQGANIGTNPCQKRILRSCSLRQAWLQAASNRLMSII